MYFGTTVMFIVSKIFQQSLFFNVLNFGNCRAGVSKSIFVVGHIVVTLSLDLLIYWMWNSQDMVYLGSPND